MPDKDKFTCIFNVLVDEEVRTILQGCISETLVGKIIAFAVFISSLDMDEYCSCDEFLKIVTAVILFENVT